MTKENFIQILTDNNVFLNGIQAQSLWEWLNEESNVENDSSPKNLLFMQYVKSGDLSKINNIFSMYLWLQGKPVVDEEIQVIDESMDGFHKNMKHIYQNYPKRTPALLTRTTNWITGKDFKDVNELIAYGSKNMKNDRNMGNLTICFVREILKKCYGVKRW